MKLILLNFLFFFTFLGFSQEKGKTILENLKANKEYSTFVKGLEMTGLDKALDSKEGDKMTVFAPTNKAFDNRKDFFNSLFSEKNIQLLTEIFSRHLSKDQFGQEEMDLVREHQGAEGKELMINTLMGARFQIKPFKDNIYIIKSEQFGEVYITESNLFNSNGTYHSLSNCLVEQ